MGIEEWALLTARELRVLDIAIRGVPTKALAYEVGVSSSTISRWLAEAARKLGLESRLALLREAARCAATEPRDFTQLTPAEREVLALVCAGLSNAAIARLRSRSERTIANQVASMLRKTESDSRRALVIAATRATNDRETQLALEP